MARKSKEEKQDVVKKDREVLLDTDKIMFGVDKKGEAYSPKRNPHRPGTLSYDRWPMYKSGMTVKQALGAGLTRSDIRGARMAGHIQIVRVA